jgi:hypothetical protein
MKQDYITNRIYKNLQYPVLGRYTPNQAGYFILSLSIKGRVERDCLNVSENKTEILSNTYSDKAGLPAPTSEDNSCMMRVIKETGIEKCGRPENEGRPIKVRNNDLKLTLKFNLYRLFTPFQL